MNAREFEKIFHALYLPLGMYALRIVNDTDDAQDIVQDAFVRAWHNIADEGVIVTNIKAYLYRSVRNLAIEFLRQNRRYCDLDDVETVSDEDIDLSERDACLWRAVDALPERCREVFLMSKRDGMTGAQIADELGISIKTVENQITKAFRSLRATLNPSLHLFFFPFL
jgi:RNA polymerase sigma-70 factor (ECF subfamily)